MPLLSCPGLESGSVDHSATQLPCCASGLQQWLAIYWLQVPFEDVPGLVAKRHVLLARGQAYVQQDQARCSCLHRFTPLNLDWPLDCPDELSCSRFLSGLVVSKAGNWPN